jgi:hypothetical protein
MLLQHKQNLLYRQMETFSDFFFRKTNEMNETNVNWYSCISSSDDIGSNDGCVWRFHVI